MTQFIDEHKDVYGVEPICDALQFATSTYYAVKARQADPSARARRDATQSCWSRSAAFTSTATAPTAPRKCGASCVARTCRRRAARSSG
jgi:hypothetical protein